MCAYPHNNSNQPNTQFQYQTPMNFVHHNDKLTSITRKRHKKSKLGCPQCKKRKVKCDESLPACTKCVNRKVRCGYLDYDAADIDAIRISHNEFESVDLSKIPITHHKSDYNVSSFSRLPTPKDELNTSSSDAPSPLDGVTFDNYTVHKTTSISPKSFTTEGLDLNSSKLLKYSDNKSSITLKLLPHHIMTPTLDISRYPSYFNETISGFAIRFFIKKSLFDKIIHAFNDYMEFNGALIMGYGPLLSKIPKLESYFLKSRGICMNIILKESSNINDENVIGLRNLSVHLDTSSVFLRGGISYKQHFKLSTGPTTIIKKVYENPSKFPKSYTTIKGYGDAMLYTNKYVWIPQYNHQVLSEFYEVVKEYGELYVNSNPLNENSSIEDQNLSKDYKNLLEFTEFCNKLFSNEKSNDLVLRYPINKLYELQQRWFAIFPSQCCMLDNSRMSGKSKVFYVFWFVLLRLLESFIISCRYLFTFFLDGFFLTYPFKREFIDRSLENLNDDKLNEIFNYSCRVISFFGRRMVIVLRNTILNGQIPIFLELKDRLKARPLDIHERCITSFKNTVIRKVHYPSDLTNLNGLEDSKDDLIAYYSKKTKVKNDIDLSEDIKDLDTKDDFETIDILNNINKETSLLNNDYDPRYIDEIFNEKVEFQPATLAYFDNYMEDRRLIVQMIDDEDDSSDSDLDDELDEDEDPEEDN